MGDPCLRFSQSLFHSTSACLGDGQLWLCALAELLQYNSMGLPFSSLPARCSLSCVSRGIEGTPLCAVSVRGPQAK